MTSRHRLHLVTGQQIDTELNALAIISAFGAAVNTTWIKTDGGSYINMDHVVLIEPLT